MEQYSQEVQELWCKWCVARGIFVPIRQWVTFCHPREVWDALARSRGHKDATEEFNQAASR